MPKMYDKHTALVVIMRAAEKIAQTLESKGIVEADVSKGELRRLFNSQGGRGKDVFSMALRRFVVGEVIATSRWELRVVEPEKPRIHFKLRRLTKK